MNFDKQFWDKKYKTNKIGWDLGEISPPLKTYFDQLKNKEIKILIPGGGNSYEAEYLFKNGFKNVFVIDISEFALKNLKNRQPSFPTANLIHANFFDFKGSFDLIIEQTFFCAINPNLRQQYATKMASLLKENGKVVGLLFNTTLNEDHPPFGGSKKDYVTIFKPYFTTVKMDDCYNSYPNRQGMELFIKLQK